MSEEHERQSEHHALAVRPEMSVSAVNETPSAALAARARADIEARAILAVNRPRSVNRFRERLLEACKRTAFAGVARYSKPLGGNKFAEGFTIRFAEEVVRHYGNLDISTMVVSESQDQRVVRCAVTDLETNVPWSTEVVIPKTVERRNVKDGDVVIAKRQNSTGQSVYIKAATEDEIAISQNRLCAKAIRNLVLNHAPSDILEEAEIEILTMTKAEDDRDPTAARKKVADSFFKFGVTADDLAAFLGHTLDTMNNAELHVLRKIWTGMKEDSTIRWADIMAEKTGKPSATEATTNGTSTTKGAGSKLADLLTPATVNVVGKALDAMVEEVAPGAIAASEGGAPAKKPEPLTVRPPRITKLLKLEAEKKLTDDEAEDLRQFRADHPELFPTT